MKKFSIEDYFKDAEKRNPINNQNKLYIEYFYNYLKRSSEEVNDNILSLLSTQDVLDSLSSYMDKSNSYARKTATQYIGGLKILFKDLERFYQIRNNICINENFTHEFETEIQKFIERYNDAEDKETVEEKIFKDLLSKVKELENQYLRQEVLNDIDKCLLNKTKNGSSLYNNILSICATRLLIEFAFKSDVIRKLTISDIDLDNGAIIRGRYRLMFSSELRKDIDEYIIIRKYLMDKIGKKEEVLFVKINGSPADSTPDYANTFFGKTISPITGKVASEPFARRQLRIMIKEGFNIKTISEITGYKDTTLNQMCEFINDNEVGYIQNKLNEFLVHKKGIFRCPFCGEIKRINANEWVLVQIGDNETKYLACKDCEGADGEIKY